MALTPFHPAVAAWFQETYPAPSDCQEQAWRAIREGKDTLIAAPTGSGKTLAAFLSAIDDLVRQGVEKPLEDATQVLYISPLKALGNDIQKNLEIPLGGINRKLFELGFPDISLRSQVRSGDTPAASRAAMVRQPPHILVTTPESVYILLTSEGGRRMLGSVRTVIVDEIHAILGSKRGSHLALSLERLERLVKGPLARIGLSATQRPIETVARFLSPRQEDCRIIDTGHRRRLDLDIELPQSPLEAVLSGEAAKDIYERMAELIRSHRTTLVFVNTRRMAERLARALSERIGEDNITSHHGSLAKEQRLSAECRLKAGQLKALVATASLELGIDIGDVDLVCQLGTTGSIATFLQRAGRSGHFAGGTPKARLFPTSRDELVECLALLDAIRLGELDRLCIPEQPLDVLAQQIAAMVACEDWEEDALFEAVTRAWPYRNLQRSEFDQVVAMLSEGFSTRRGQRAAYLHRDRIHGRLRARRGTRLTALTCGGAIPDNADYRVIQEPSGDFIGTVDEDFAIESMSGDIFQLGNTSWRVLRLDAGSLRVEDAHGQPPSIPFWFGEAPGRTRELSLSLSRLRVEIAEHWLTGSATDDRIEATSLWLQERLGIGAVTARQAVSYIAAAQATLGAMPSFDTVVFERFFDESGGMQFIIHAPFGSRLNRAWGLALRKRFCRSFNFELQAAATENAVILSLSTAHSFPLEEAARYLHANTVRDILIQALLAAPMFNVRWRWNAVCALALKRFQGGKKTPPYLIRMQAEDLVASVFPDQLACLENIVGDRQVPDHPLVRQTIHDCLTEAMDIDRLIELIRAMETGQIKVVCRDLVEPSPLAAEIVNSRVYSFLDGAPLEERRTRAVASRRWLDPATADDLGRLDEAAIDRVCEEAWPEAENAEELHDGLLLAAFLRSPAETPAPWQRHLAELSAQGRATRLSWEGGALWIAAERLPQFQVLHPELRCEPVIRLPEALCRNIWEPESALVEILRSRLSATGPVEAADLARALALPPAKIEAALTSLETEGFLLRGRFRAEGGPVQWCERRLLARIHQHTIHRLRKEIEPVSGAEFMRFLFHWQRLDPASRGDGPDALSAVLQQLEGFESAAGAWERDILPSRLNGYDPAWLDLLCLSGRFVWQRLTPAEGTQAPVKSSPIAFLERRHAYLWQAPDAEAAPGAGLSGPARRVFDILRAEGASFFQELSDRSGLLDVHLENALGELVARGLAHSDGFRGLRALLVPEAKKHRMRGLQAPAIAESGRWTLVTGPGSGDASDLGSAARARAEHISRVLLRRYGVVFKALLAREASAPPWQELLKVLRTQETRGDIRGGRFVAGQFGEQFALPEAVESLRAIRRREDDTRVLALSAADPLNLVGIVTPGPKLPAQAGNRVLYRGGIPLAVLSARETRWLEPVAVHEQWAIQNQLIRRTAVHQAMT